MDRGNVNQEPHPGPNNAENVPANPRVARHVRLATPVQGEGGEASTNGPEGDAPQLADNAAGPTAATVNGRRRITWPVFRAFNGTNNTALRQGFLGGWFAGAAAAQTARRQRQTNLILMQRHLLYTIFSRMCRSYCGFFPASIRRLIEFMLLVMAVALLALLTYVHAVLSKQLVPCLSEVAKEWPVDGVLRVELLPGCGKNYTLLDSYKKEYPNDPAAMRIWYGLDEREVALHDALLIGSSDNLNPYEYWRSRQCMVHPVMVEFNDLPAFIALQDPFPLHTGNPAVVSYQDVLLDTHLGVLDLFDLATEDLSEESHIMEYSVEYGFLRLSPRTRRKLNITVFFVVLDPEREVCFGSRFERMLLRELVGHSDVLMNSVKHMVESNNYKGYLRNVITGENYRFVHMETSRLMYGVAVLIMMLFTALVSLLLRFSHNQVFFCIVEAFNSLEINNGVRVIVPASPLLVIILALVGLETIMSDFFSETTLAFYIILIIWIADQYHNICCHTPLSHKHWPRFFFLYHCGFYLHHYRFNGQYSGLALITSWAFIQHSMVYFLHHYELPAMEAHEEGVEGELPETGPQSRTRESSSQENEQPENPAGQDSDAVEAPVDLNDDTGGLEEEEEGGQSNNANNELEQAPVFPPATRNANNEISV